MHSPISVVIDNTPDTARSIGTVLRNPAVIHQIPNGLELVRESLTLAQGFNDVTEPRQVERLLVGFRQTGESAELFVNAISSQPATGDIDEKRVTEIRERHGQGIQQLQQQEFGKTPQSTNNTRAADHGGRRGGPATRFQRLDNRDLPVRYGDGRGFFAGEVDHRSRGRVVGPAPTTAPLDALPDTINIRENDATMQMDWGYGSAMTAARPHRLAQQNETPRELTLKERMEEKKNAAKLPPRNAGIKELDELWEGKEGRRGGGDGGGGGGKLGGPWSW